MDDSLAKLPGYALRRAANAMIGDLTARLAEADMRLSEASVLMLIGQQQDVTASVIGRTLDIQRANMVPLLNRLELAGLVERVPINRKSFAIVLSGQGLAKLDEVLAITTRFEADLINRIPEAHRAHFVPALNALWR